MGWPKGHKVTWRLHPANGAWDAKNIPFLTIPWVSAESKSGSRRRNSISTHKTLSDNLTCRMLKPKPLLTAAFPHAHELSMPTFCTLCSFMANWVQGTAAEIALPTVCIWAVVFRTRERPVEGQGFVRNLLYRFLQKYCECHESWAGRKVSSTVTFLISPG